MRPRPGAEAARVHGHRDPVAVADGQHEQADEQPRMPRPAQAADAARLAERREVVGEARHGLVRGQRAVGEPIGDVGLLDERIDQARRLRGQREDDPDRGDRDDPSPTAVAVAIASWVTRNGPMRAISVAVGSVFAAPNTMLLTTTTAATDHSGSEGPDQVARSDAAEADPGDERDGRDQRAVATAASRAPAR